MKFISFEQNGMGGYGIWEDEDIWYRAPSDFLKTYPDLKSVISANKLDELYAATIVLKDAIPVSGAKLLPVIPNPGKIFCVGLNYKNHVVEMKRADTEHPAIFVRFADSLGAHDQPLLKPKQTNCFDYEGELAVVIGKGGQNITQEYSWNHIAGYACFNDGSARDWQRHTTQWTAGKNFPMTGPFGPFMATHKIIPDVNQLTLETRLNGEVMQHASLDDLIFTIPVIIEYISSFTALSPGDVIATGTPGGVGDKRVPPVYMKPRDIVEVEITGLGTLRNQVLA